VRSESGSFELVVEAREAIDAFDYARRARGRTVGSTCRSSSRPNLDRHRDVPTVSAHLVFTLLAP
jgi:hypothetical protein